ncbi:unnamed protein product (macronuclear) [Paramecium tetraurelia]|uniref:Uncharacterized protein n=1 Tax=Paramecium tetraurelia TaxID=5888 RepID=A0BMZ4_PARTE|nr:uncharacterized protein GSPATT00030548001 [Paramecium tetraurelia]CAK59911.1 unnamed protein product [Paramecium tetraurelia]|eukprot:XP_001427309.1 hypothetical protein (macronuclear) [Paramecium tetraurelia strain d4-2]
MTHTNNIALQTSYDHFLNFDLDEMLPETPLGPWFIQKKKEPKHIKESPLKERKQFVIKKQNHKHMLTEPVKYQDQIEEISQFKQPSVEQIIKQHFTNHNLKNNKSSQGIRERPSTNLIQNKVKQQFTRKKEERVSSVILLTRKKNIDLQLDKFLKLYHIYKIPLLNKCNITGNVCKLQSKKI